MEEELRAEQYEELLRRFNEDIADADGGAELDGLYRKYEPILRTMTPNQVEYHKHLLAMKAGRARIQDPDLREVWTVLRKVLHGIRIMSARG